MARRKLVLMPPRILWLLLSGSAALHWGFGLSTPVFRSALGGALLVAAGVGINVWASRIFEEDETPIRPDQVPRTIVERGPFRWSRNPMYLGLISLTLGAALIVGSVPFWIAAGIYAAILRGLFVPHEEHVLRETFGAEYEAYAARVSRWLGRLGVSTHRARTKAAWRRDDRAHD